MTLVNGCLRAPPANARVWYCAALFPWVGRERSLVCRKLQLGLIFQRLQKFANRKASRHHNIVAIYVAAALTGLPKQGDKIQTGYLTPTFLGANKWAELLPNPCVNGSCHTRGRLRKWLPHPYLVGGPQGLQKAEHKNTAQNLGTELGTAVQSITKAGTNAGDRS